MVNQFNIDTAQKLIDQTCTLFWFRRDLRLEDNAGLYHALKENEAVLPIFIFDTVILDKLEDKADRRVEFILHSLKDLYNKFQKLGSSLLILHGDPVDIFKKLHPRAVYCNRDYEPYAAKRDGCVEKILTGKGVTFKTFKDHVIFEKDEVIKDNGDPYTVFTPYSRKWKKMLNAFYKKSYPTAKYLSRLRACKPVPLPSLETIGFEAVNSDFPPRIIKVSTIEKYHQQRDYPAIRGTTRLSVHLRFGTVSIRKLVEIACKKNETWLNELIWREFYAMILWHFPHVETRSFKPVYDRIPWRNDADEFRKWCDGNTGYPVVDAGMRELNATGFMHNRIRMVVASFLTKHLLIDWRWGEAYFAKKLLDYDMASNNGGWQWAAGSGCDAAPYFRIFNPMLQAKKFDPNHDYIRQWVPEADTENYAKPIVDHQHARARALRVYKSGLGNF